MERESGESGPWPGTPPSSDENGGPAWTTSASYWCRERMGKCDVGASRTREDIRLGLVPCVRSRTARRSPRIGLDTAAWEETRRSLGPAPESVLTESTRHVRHEPEFGRATATPLRAA